MLHSLYLIDRFGLILTITGVVGYLIMLLRLLHEHYKFGEIRLDIERWCWSTLLLTMSGVIILLVVSVAINHM